MPHLASSSTTLRLTLHVLSASIWVGGQLVIGAVVPRVRKEAPGMPALIARAFAKIGWPAYAVLMLTGIWNVFAINLAKASTSYKIALTLLILAAIVSGISAFLHQTAKSTRSLAIFGAISGISATIALALGVLVAG